jgi:hypothetical protein
MLYSVAVESAASLAAGKAIAAIFPPTGKTLSLRRLVVGGRGATTNQPVTAAVIYTESAGTPSTGPATLQPIGAAQYLGENNAEGNAFGQFSVDPAYGAYPLYELSLSSLGGSQTLAWNSGDFAVQFFNAENGIMLYTVNSVPSGYLYTVSFEIEIL